MYYYYENKQLFSKLLKLSVQSTGLCSSSLISSSQLHQRQQKPNAHMSWDCVVAQPDEDD